MGKLKFAIIGCGRISFKHIEALVANKDEVELVAVCDIVFDRALSKKVDYEEKTMSKLKINVYDDYEKMLKNEKIDVVAIATESGYHAEIAIRCMENGKNVIVEKPMALSIEDADKMIEVAKINKVKLCVSHQNRFNKPIKRLRAAIEAGDFGKLINGTARILWNRNMGYYQQAPWRGTWRLDGGTLMNQCIHDIDLLQWMFGGEIDTVYSQADTFIRDIEGEDFGVIVIRFKTGAIGIVEGTACVFPKNIEETLSVFGEKGTVVIGGLAVNKIQIWNFENAKNNEIVIACADGKDPDTVYGSGHTPLYKDVIDSINNNRKPLIDGEEGKKAMSIILAAYKSRLTDMPVKFPLDRFSTQEMIGIKTVK